uniref:Multidrug resistance-associated protein lethal(2)03659 n=1 Tax=Timema monikensis TaxID=170555 RepID=A0A7R9E0L7_9NEOP|nr:unnamed protein product [Timema monikensis]
MLEYFKPGSNVPKEYAYYYAGGIVATTGLSMFLINQFQFNAFHIGMKLRVACCSLVYRKSLRLSRSALGDTAAGKVVNLLSNDVSRFDILLMFLNQLWLAPLIAIIVMYLIVAETGVSGAVGVIVVFLVVPLQSYTGKLTAVFRRKTAQRTDERIRLMDEIISGIRVIKMYAWEKPFADLIRMARKKAYKRLKSEAMNRLRFRWPARSEIRIIRKTSFLRGIFMSFNMCTTRLAVFATLITLVLQGNRLSADREFLLLDEFIKIEKTTNGSLMQKKLTDRDGVSLKDVTAKWNENSSDNTLEKLFLSANKGKLVAIIGQVGSGKSSLLQAILGELPISSGSCLVNGSLSYACQEPWVFAATIRQNIVFGTPFNQKRYDEVVRVCALVRDFELFPQGDLTMVGERGTSLSGGQKARVNLARAVYNDADVYLLDDPLSAVDTHVGKHLFDECINSYLKHKTRILVTHQLQYLKDADNIVIIKQGQIQMQGSYADLMKSEIDYAKLLGVEELDEIEDIVDYQAEVDQENIRLPRILRQFSRMSTRSTRSKVSRRSSIALESEIVELDPPSSDHIEKSSKGKIARSMYIEYMRAGTNICGFLGVVLMFLLSQGAASGADYWMSYWVTQEESLAYYDQLPDNYTELNRSFEDTNIILIPREDLFSTETSLHIYTAIIVFLLVITFSRAIIFYAMCMKSSQGLHNSMFNGITKTRMRFFDVNPSGRVLNRFSKDIGSVDEILPKALLDATQILVTALGALVVSVIVNYLFIIPVCVIGFICYFIREVYLKISKDLKRLEGITKSPVFTHLNATLQGLSTIRAYKAQDILRNEFDKHQDLHSSAYFLFIGTSVTFGFYLDLFSLIFISLVTFSFLLLEETFGGNVGLAITQSLGLVGLLQWGIRQSAEVANNMMSVERVLEYKYLEQEPLLESAPDKLPAGDWPSKGLIQFEHTSMKYVETDPQVLKDLNITIRPSEKVGIVGRTGAGKSSLISALFRLARVEGTIRIDGVDTKDIGLQDLRSRISIIPQDPVLFSGTLRKNLDPFDHFSDFDLWNALEDVELKDSYDSGDGLRSKVTEGGSNFSVGQRQLICLARAILRNNKILMLDEATANVDPQTDALIQKTIRLKFADCTVLTVAHRLNTIMDSDKVLVMDAGRMVEFDHPYLLLQNKNGHFSKMVQETGKAIVDQLTRIAQEASGEIRTLTSGCCGYHLVTHAELGVIEQPATEHA